MDNFTEKEALYILRHRKQYTDDEIDKAINKIKRINSHRAEYIKRYKKRLKESLPKKEIENKIKEINGRIEEYEKKKYKIWVRKYNIIKNDYKVVEVLVETSDIYHEIGLIYCTTTEEIKRIDYQLLEE